MVWRLLKTTNDRIIMIDNLSVGSHPDQWIGIDKTKEYDNVVIYSDANSERVYFIKEDARETFRSLRLDNNFLEISFQLTI